MYCLTFSFLVVSSSTCLSYVNVDMEKKTEFDMYFLFYKQPVNKLLVLGWQIAKQLSGFILFSLSNNESYRSKKNGIFSL